MSDARTAWATALYSVGLAVAGLGVLVLLYALATRVLFPTASPVRTANPAGLPGDIIQVEVRNGCGASGVARVTTQFLRRHHFDVLGSGNYRHFNQERSLVIDRVGNREAALSVAAALGIAEEHVVEEINPALLLDATVVIGHDYPALRPFTEADGL